MKAEDLIPAGDRAKRLLRVAQALTVLSKSRAPTLSQVNNAITRLKGPQPAVAMALLLDYAKRHPLHERRECLKAAENALDEYRLSEDADQEEAKLVNEYLKQQLDLCQAEIEKRERIQERNSLISLGVLTLLIIAALGYVAYYFLKNNKGSDNESEKTAVEKPVVVEKAPEKKPASPRHK